MAPSLDLTRCEMNSCRTEATRTVISFYLVSFNWTRAERQNSARLHDWLIKGTQWCRAHKVEMWDDHGGPNRLYIKDGQHLWAESSSLLFQSFKPKCLFDLKTWWRADVTLCWKWAPQMFELSLLQLSSSCSSVIDVSVIVSSSAVGLLTQTFSLVSLNWSDSVVIKAQAGLLSGIMKTSLVAAGNIRYEESGCRWLHWFLIQENVRALSGQTGSHFFFYFHRKWNPIWGCSYILTRWWKQITSNIID